MVYQAEYHRCVFEQNESHEGILFLVMPLLLICALYIFITIVMVKKKIKVTKVIISTSAIIASGMLVAIPEILMATFYLQMSYEVAQILTVTLYYTNSIFNPLIYFCLNPRVSEQISQRVSVKWQSQKSCSSDNVKSVYLRPPGRWWLVR